MPKGDTIKYKDGYKHQLYEDYSLQTDISLPEDVSIPFGTLTKDGLLTAHKGYAWDGASGPTWDNFTFKFWKWGKKKRKKVAKRGSLVHDILCQFLREELLHQQWRAYVDRLLREICIEDDMWSFRAEVWEWMVHRLGKKSATHEGRRKIITAP